MIDPDPTDGTATPFPGVPGRSGDGRTVTRTAGAGRRRWLSPRQLFWATYGLLFAVTALWSLASPPMAGLDEPAHTIKAAGVVRGELTGSPFAVDLTAPMIWQSQQDGRGLVDVTALFAQLNELPKCFAFKSDVPASCQPDTVADPDAPADAMTSASRYNPLYYAVVGIPSLLPGSAATVYLMRLVSALLACALLAMAFRTIAELPRSLWPAVAATVAITPMVVFLNSTVNPQAVELAGGLTIWVTLLSVLRAPDAALLRRRLARLTVATVFFVNARGLGPLFLAAIVATAVLCSPIPTLLSVLRDRRSWPFLATCTAAGIAAVGWILFVGSLVTSPTVNFPEYADTGTIVATTLGHTSDYVEQSLGLFGWLDVMMPAWTLHGLAACVLCVVFAGLAVGRRRDRLTILLLVTAAVVIPVVAHVAQARYIGLFWQGRYILPLAFGVPLVAGFALHERAGGIPPWITRRLAGWLLGVVAGLQCVAYAVNLHRYVNGWDGSWFATDGDSWQPPLPSVLLLMLTALGWTALAVVVFRGSDHGYAERPSRPPAARVPTESAAPTATGRGVQPSR